MLINDYKAQVKARLLGRQTPCAVALLCSNSDVKAEGLAVFWSVKSNTDVKGMTGLWFLVHVGQTRAGGEQNRQTGGQAKTVLLLFFAVWQWHTTHWWVSDDRASEAAAVTFSIVVVTKEISLYLRVFEFLSTDVRFCGRLTLRTSGVSFQT